MLKAALVSGIVALGLISGGAINDANAEVRVKIKTKYYTVKGKTGVQLYKSILQRGPKANTQHAIATTQLSKFVFRNVDGDVVGRNCKITKVDTDIELTYTYPKWRDYNKASKTLRASWDRFYKFLVKHEEKHGKIYIAGVKDMERRLKRTRDTVASGCANLSDKMDSALARAANRMNLKQIRFDRREGSRFSRITRAELKLLRGK